MIERLAKASVFIVSFITILTVIILLFFGDNFQLVQWSMYSLEGSILLLFFSASYVIYKREQYKDWF